MKLGLLLATIALAGLAYQQSAVEAFPGANGRIAFHSNRDGDNYEVYTMKPEGTDTQRLTNSPGPDEQPAWSWAGNGGGVVFTTHRDGNYEIYTMSANGSNQTNVSNNLAIDEKPGWAPTGGSIVFQSARDGNVEIYTMDANGNNATRLTTNLAEDTDPAWSPDASKIMFISDRDGNPEIYTMNPDGTNQTNLSTSSFIEQDARWSPDGSQIVFVSDRHGNLEVYRAPAGDLSAPVRITNDPGNDQNPFWSPDGTRIAFDSPRDGEHEIFTADPSGENVNVIQVTTNTSFDCCPDWQAVLGVGGMSSLTGYSAEDSGHHAVLVLIGFVGIAIALALTAYCRGKINAHDV